MEQQTIRKTSREKLRPTAAQEWALETVLARCRDLDHAALEQRITAWQRRRVSVSRFEQEAELTTIRAEVPDYAAIHAHILHDVLARLDTTSQAFFRRVQRGEQAGFPRLQGQQSLPLLRLQGGRQRRAVGEWLPGALADRAHQRAVESPDCGHAQGPPKTVTIAKEAAGW